MITHILTPTQDSRQSSVPESISDLKMLVSTYQVNNNFVNGREQFAVRERPKDGKMPGRWNNAPAATTAMASTTNTGKQEFDCPCGAKKGPSHDANQCQFLKQRCRQEFNSSTSGPRPQGKEGNFSKGHGHKHNPGSGGNHGKPTPPKHIGAGKPAVKFEGNTSNWLAETENHDPEHPNYRLLGGCRVRPIALATQEGELRSDLRDRVYLDNLANMSMVCKPDHHVNPINLDEPIGVSTGNGVATTLITGTMPGVAIPALLLPKLKFSILSFGQCIKYGFGFNYIPKRNLFVLKSANNEDLAHFKPSWIWVVYSI